MKRSAHRVPLLCLGLALAACQPAPPEPQVAAPAGDVPVGDAAAGVAPSPASPPPTEVPAATPAPRPGTARLAGRVAYPGEEFPAMRVCAIAPQDPGTGYCTDTAVNQPHFALDLPPGAWWLLAWPRDTGTVGDPGLLSAASDCLDSGGTGCDDHALREVVVAAGEVREGLDINDWYYDPQAMPPPMEPRGEALD